MRRNGLLAVGLALLLAAPAATALAAPARGASEGALARYYEQSIEWRPCEDGAQCGTLTVPLDYGEPDAGDITIALLRVPSTSTSPSGSLIVNPGGPGAAGIGFANYVAGTMDARVRSAFDIVGFDPRGVDASTPITCVTGRQTTEWLLADPTPDTAREQARLMSLAGQFSPGCLRFNAVLARNIGTERTIADMDVLRGVLGDDKLNLLGFSYGTALGVAYAERYPDRVGRFVLDGAVDPALDAMQLSRGQNDGFQQAVQRFAQDCARRSTCPYSGGAARVLAGINSLLKRLDAKPLPSDGGAPLVQAQAVTALFFSMYSPDYWPILRNGLTAAKEGDGSVLQDLSDAAWGRIGPNRYEDNQNSAFYAISCWDYPATPGRPGLAAAAKEWSRAAKVAELARAMSWGNAPCSTWFGHSVTPPAPAATTTSAPILVIGTRFDPATPYPWAVSLSRQLPTSTLLTYAGDGHTAYLTGSRCIDAAVSGYLVAGTVPPAGTVCPA